MEISERIQAFSQFVNLLSGEFNIPVTTAQSPLPGAIVLPDLGNMDEESLDVLYGLCLREAGNLYKRKGRAAALRKINTKRELEAVMWVDGARSERLLTRKFGGAGDILSEHFGRLAHSPRFSKVILGVEPQAATPDQKMLLALKWNLLGRPRFGWEKLFGEDFSKADEFLQTIKDSWQVKLRNTEDSVALSLDVLNKWYAATKTCDESPIRTPSLQEKAFEKAQEALSGRLSIFAQEQSENIEKELEKERLARQQYNKKRAELAPVLDPLREKINVLTKMRKKYDGVRDKINDINSAHQKSDRLEKRHEKIKVREEKVDERLNKIQKTKEAPDFSEKREALDKSFEEKREALLQKMQEIIERQEKLEAQKKGASEVKNESLEKKIQSLEQKQEEVARRMEALESVYAQKASDLDKKESLALDRQQERSERMEAHVQELSQKKEGFEAERQSLEKELKSLEEGLQKMSMELESSLKKAGLASTQEEVDNCMQKIKDLSNERHKAENEWKESAAPLEALRTQMQEAQKSSTAAQKEAQWQMEKELRQLEKDLSQSGVEIDLTEKMEEVEGWPEANQAQRSWDNKMSENFKESVINGCGGGRGNRDLMVTIEETRDAIEDIDPRLIFADVESLSPMTGLVEAGSGNSQSNSSGATATEVSAAAPLHTVWSKRFDVIRPAPQKNSSVLRRLQSENAGDIRRVREIFKKMLKPSYKPKFVGGKEEGDLDVRNLWKLAARQDNDFFEVTRRKPDQKSCASILVDLSGSLSSLGDHAAEKLQRAVLLLSEGLSACHIPHEILGYSAPVHETLSEQKIPETFNRKTCALETIIIKSFKDKDLSGIASIEIKQADNSDGESVRVALKRLSREPARQKMMFIVSDGKPYMQDSDTEILDEDLRRALLDAASQKVKVWGLGPAEGHPVMGESYTPLTHDLVQSLENMLKEKQ